MTVAVLDVVTRVTPLGLRFLDTATGATVSDGLRVSYESAQGPALAEPNHAGVYLVTGLPGLAASERGAGDEAFWAAPPASAVATIEVVDALGRFLPFRFDADVPFKGWFAPWCASPASPPDLYPSVPLSSSPGRVAPAGGASLRLELRDRDAPAAWARVEVLSDAGAVLAAGIADGGGRVLVPFAYPPLPATPGAMRALTSQSWTVGVRAFYDRLEPEPSRPHDLCELLGQAPVQLLGSESPPTPLSALTLEYGRELTAVTAGHNVVVVSAP